MRGYIEIDGHVWESLQGAQVARSVIGAALSWLPGEDGDVAEFALDAEETAEVVSYLCLLSLRDDILRDYVMEHQDEPGVDGNLDAIKECIDELLPKLSLSLAQMMLGQKNVTEFAWR